MNIRQMTRRPPEERFWARVDKREDCWIWLGYSRRGYGSLRIGNGKYMSAHRFSYELHIGPIRQGAFVLHSCDVRLCVNPNHLYLGNHRDNMRDARDRQRHPRGEQNHLSRLTEDKVVEIRKLHSEGIGVREIGRRYGVSHGTIIFIVKRRTWAHV